MTNSRTAMSNRTIKVICGNWSEHREERLAKVITKTKNESNRQVRCVKETKNITLEIDGQKGINRNQLIGKKDISMRAFLSRSNKTIILEYKMYLQWTTRNASESSVKKLPSADTSQTKVPAVDWFTLRRCTLCRPDRDLWLMRKDDVPARGERTKDKFRM